METKGIKKQFGLFVGIAMVVGVVIGSGVFLKAGGVLELSGGDLKLSLLAWLVGGLIMIVSGFCFATFATKVTKFNGVIDYVELSSNSRVGYHLSWLFSSLYYPIVDSVVSIFAGAFFLDLIGVAGDIGVIYEMLGRWETYIVAFVFLTLISFLNYYAPKLQAKFQVSATIIKLIPILVIVLAGIICSLFIPSSGISIAQALTVSADGYVFNFGEAVKKTAFAYEGWVCATAINAELKDSKKQLPLALTIGTIAVVIFYVLYYLGMSAMLGNAGTIEAGANAPLIAFTNIFGVVGSKIFTAFIVISCLGTVNGVNIACSRGFYTMACRGLGPCPDKVAKINEKTGTSFLSCLMGYGCTVIVLGIWYLAFNGIGIFACLDSMDEIVCAIIYAMYILIYINIIKNFKELNTFNRYVMPILAITGSVFFCLCGSGLYQLIFSGSVISLRNFGVFTVLMIIFSIPSFFFYRKPKEVK